MRIVDLTEHSPEIEQVAALLADGFRDTGSATWQTIDEAHDEVQESLAPGRISRIAMRNKRRLRRKSKR
jgi:hypothetical protein